MAKQATTDKLGGISTAAVEAATGKSWAEWLRILDRAGAKRLDHKGIVALVHGRFGIGSWWQQMVTVGYEQARGLRAKHQKTDGFSVSRSRTIASSVAAAFVAWTDARRRSRWLKRAGVTITTSTPHKSVRMRWPEHDSRVEVNLYAKGDNKCQVAVQHNRLPDAKAAAKMKAFWGEALDRLATALDCGECAG